MAITLVMAVDDEAAILKLIELHLKATGFEVMPYGSAQEALKDIEEGLRPDVILSDVSMPNMDGFAFYEKVREYTELRAVPFLFLTALGEREHIRYGMSVGADDYVTKPFQRDGLVQAIKVRLKRIDELRRPLEGVIKVKGLGHPLVEKNGARLNWDSLKALELLFYLLEHRSGVSTFEVAEALWPGKPESKASSSFHTTLYRLRRVMGGEIVESANRRYYLHSKFDIDYDVEVYRQALADSRERGTLSAYKNAVASYSGEFLLGFDSIWIDNIRNNLQTEFLTLLLTTAEKAAEEQQFEDATRFYQQMTEVDQYNDVAWEGLIASLQAQGHKGRAEEMRVQFDKLMSEI